VCAAILLPARLILFSTEGLLLTVADGLYAVASNSELYKLVTNSIGTEVVKKSSIISLDVVIDFTDRK